MMVLAILAYSCVYYGIMAILLADRYKYITNLLINVY